MLLPWDSRDRRPESNDVRRVCLVLVNQKKPLPKPLWIRNTYFWIGAALLILGIVGLPMFGGDHMIRDAGQKHEDRLYIDYLLGSAVAFVNGWLSHRQTVTDFMETAGTADNASQETSNK